MKRCSLTARGATISFLMDELRRFGDALGALVDDRDGIGQFTDDHMEVLTELHTKMREAALLAEPGKLTEGARLRLTRADIGECD